MLDKILFWKVLVFAFIALILSIADMCLISGNKDIQREINGRQNVISTAKRVASLNQQLSQALYDISVKNNDQQARDLLVSQGFVIPQKPALVPMKPKKKGKGK